MIFSKIFIEFELWVLFINNISEDKSYFDTKFELKAKIIIDMKNNLVKKNIFMHNFKYGFI